ncbi:MAG: hypothetical protein LUQ50_15255 [Methanospirillum sp.]|uniref:hypothetical protein n=1 Tax=Methanospirillum sp. TaxID=45200 RepID=UPI00236F26A2|nr:hypothetical protein [Methanospirillum sp.]MDD1730411.1 hypothetical protein [Methanospirillum sp.]
MAELLPNNFLDEWKEIRTIIGRYEGNLLQIRTYGFAFLAALFTVNSLQILVTTISNEYVRFGLIVLTIVFIVALWLLDLDYRKLEEAAIIRARILETMLNIEITDTITGKYERHKLYDYEKLVYSSFIIIAGILGIIIVPPGILDILIIIISIGGILAVKNLPDILALNISKHNKDATNSNSDFISLKESLKMFFKLFSLKKIKYPENDFTEDWVIDKVECKKGETIKISCINLSSEKPIKFKNIPPFSIWVEGESKYEFLPTESNICIDPKFGIHTWLVDTDKFKQHKDTIYRIYPRGWKKPLRRFLVMKIS